MPNAPLRDPHAAVCKGDEPGTACAHRLAAVQSGDFAYDFAKAGWYWRRSAHPFQPWTRCPWCDGPLASPAVMRQRTDAIIEDILGPIRQADGYQANARDGDGDEDGG